MARRLTPVASRGVRTAIASATWGAVGVMLLSFGIGWLADAEPRTALVLGALGVTLGLLAWRLLFRGLAGRNRARLACSPERMCVFGFQPPKSYAIMAAMIALGTVLRHSAVPKPDLAVVYLAIGGALLLSSLRYHTRTDKGVAL